MDKKVLLCNAIKNNPSALEVHDPTGLTRASLLYTYCQQSQKTLHFFKNFLSFFLAGHQTYLPLQSILSQLFLSETLCLGTITEWTDWIRPIAISFL